MTTVTPGQAARNTWFKIHYKQLPPPGSWRDLPDSSRREWEDIAQAVVDTATEGSLRACGYTLADVGRFLEAEATAEAHPAPELAAAMAETRKVRDALAVILDLFAKGGDGWHARISQVNLARAYRVAQVPVPSELVRFL